jgi:hypothetical protein
MIDQDEVCDQRLLDIAAQVDPSEGIRQGLEDVARGRTRPAHEVFGEIRGEHRNLFRKPTRKSRPAALHT